MVITRVVAGIRANGFVRVDLAKRYDKYLGSPKLHDHMIYAG